MFGLCVSSSGESFTSFFVGSAVNAEFELDYNEVGYGPRGPALIESLHGVVLMIKFFFLQLAYGLTAKEIEEARLLGGYSVMNSSTALGREATKVCSRRSVAPPTSERTYVERGAKGALRVSRFRGEEETSSELAIIRETNKDGWSSPTGQQVDHGSRGSTTTGVVLPPPVTFVFSDGGAPQAPGTFAAARSTTTPPAADDVVAPLITSRPIVRCDRELVALEKPCFDPECRRFKMLSGVLTNVGINAVPDKVVTKTRVRLVCGDVAITVWGGTTAGL